MAPHIATPKAKTLIAIAIQERIVGPLFRRLSISKRQSQCHSVPGCQPAVSLASSSMDLRLSSSEYATTTPEFLARCESMAQAYRLSLGIDKHPERITDLSELGWLACVAVPALIEQIRSSSQH